MELSTADGYQGLLVKIADVYALGQVRAHQAAICGCFIYAIQLVRSLLTY